MKSFAALTLPLLLLAISAQVFGGNCPSASHLSTCKCTNETVSCFSFNKNNVDLTQDFKAIAHGHNPGDQFFEVFELNANKLESLPEDLFQGVTFRELRFNFNGKLSCVDPRAFTGLETATTRIYARNTHFGNISSRCNIFKAMSTLQNLEEINIFASNLKEIPAYAFQHNQNNLFSIDFSDHQGGSIETIGESAFSNLKNLRFLDLSYHKITKIERNAFLFIDQSDKDLVINLERNYDPSTKMGLNGESFDMTTFGTGNRKVTLNLSRNRALNYLKQETFLGFLSNKPNGINVIDMSGAPLCHCRVNKWLLQMKESLNLIDKVINAKTDDSEDFWKLSQKDLSGTPPPIIIPGTSPAPGASTASSPVTGTSPAPASSPLPPISPSTQGASTSSQTTSPSSKAPSTSTQMPIPTPTPVATCPAANHLTICKCANKMISCTSYNRPNVDLTQDLQAIKNENKRSTQIFNSFKLSVDQLDTLPDDMFRGVAFRELEFDKNEKLSCVSPRAFAGLERVTTSILARKTSFSELSPRCNIFKAMSTLHNLEIVNIYGSGITEIPSDAFGDTQNKLHTVDLSGGHGGFITKIGKDAFSNLKSLRYIDLSNHQITKIEKNAFLFNNQSNNELIINLEHNYNATTKTGLNGESFDGAFQTGTGKVVLNLAKNKALTYLKEETFKAFLTNRNNKVDMTGSPLCRCKENQWLLRMKTNLDLVDKITNLRTEDGEDFWKLSITDLNGNPTTIVRPSTSPAAPSSTATWSTTGRTFPARPPTPPASTQAPSSTLVTTIRTQTPSTNTQASPRTNGPNSFSSHAPPTSTQARPVSNGPNSFSSHAPPSPSLYR